MIHNWLKEVRDTLRDELTDTEVSDRLRSVLVMPDGSPPAIAGITFVAVHSGGVSSSEQNLGPVFTETYEIICTVSQRVRNTPEDRDGDSLYLGTTRTLSRIARKITKIISNSSALLDRVRTAIEDEDDSTGVVEPLTMFNISTPTPRYKDWYGSTDPHDGDRQPAGYSMDIVFRGGKTITKTEC